MISNCSIEEDSVESPFNSVLISFHHFGENELLDQAAGNDEHGVKRMQVRLRNMVGFFPPLGRSLLNCGILPYRKRVTSVMGAAIRVDRVDNPTDLEVDLLFTKYCNALVDLLKKNKALYNVAIIFY